MIEDVIMSMRNAQVHGEDILYTVVGGGTLVCLSCKCVGDGATPHKEMSETTILVNRVDKVAHSTTYDFRKK